MDSIVSLKHATALIAGTLLGESHLDRADMAHREASFFRQIEVSLAHRIIEPITGRHAD